MPPKTQEPKHPLIVDGVAVVSAKWAKAPPGREGDNTFAGRTLLALADGSSRNGCGDCDFTHEHWKAIVKHRAEKHGGQPEKYHRRRPQAGDQHKQLELTAGPQPEDDGATEVLTPTEADVLPAASAATKKLEKVAPAGPLDISVRELLELSESVHAAGAQLEWMTADRDKWKAEALAGRKRLAAIARQLGKASDLVSKKDGV